ncbi:hypothetical protein Tco_0877459 [Tanacetum coccineum]|uniref:Uncharacterized protein n=1 Tax=Tanacetum coccineum TaxID=301880 RepID=A0ABQ5BYL1_9ASTR
MSTQQDINAFRAQRIANTHDPLALMENTQTPFHLDHSSLITYMQHPQPNNNFVSQPLFHTNYLQRPMQNPENPKDSSDPTTAMNTALALLAKAFKVNTIPTNNNQRICLKVHYPPAIVQIALRGVYEHDPRHQDTNRFDEMLEIKDTLQQASTSGTQSDNALVYDSDGSTEVPKDENCYNHDIFNMLTHEVQYTNLQSELDRTKEKLENCIIKKEKEYAVLWNNWYRKCEECKYDKISYDKAHTDMQTKIEWLQA